MFLAADMQLYKRLCPPVSPLVRWSVRPSVHKHELKSRKTRISAPAHPSATDGHVSSLVITGRKIFFSKIEHILSIPLEAYSENQEPTSSKENENHFFFGIRQKGKNLL